MGQIKRQGEQFETHVIADKYGNLLDYGPDSGAVDAFGRQRVSNAFTLFDSTMRYDKRPDQWYEITTGSGSVNFLSNASTLELKTTTAAGDTVLRRTKQRFPYQPGKSLVSLQSFVGAPLVSGLIQEVGYFDDNNGVMLRASGTTIQFVVRSFTTGSVVENVVNQSDWNIDTFSAFDFSKAQIFCSDFEWLGVGRVRCGFVVDGSVIYCHEFNHANKINRAYMQTAILPLSYRIANSAVQASGATLQQICCSLLSEGGYEPDGPTYSVSQPLTGVPNVNGERVTAGIRMASGRTGNVILPTKIDVASESVNVVVWRLRLNPTLSGVTWAPAANGRGNVETTTAATSFSGGTIVNTGIVSQGQSSNFNIDTAIRLALGVNASGQTDTLVLTVDSDVASKALGQIGWVEVVQASKMEPARYDITIHQGATFALRLQYKTGSGLPVNMNAVSKYSQ